MEKIESFIKDLAVSLQVARIYTTEHPNFSEAVEKAYNSITEILNDRGELLIGFVGEELAFEKEIFFDLSKKLKPFILAFKERKIEKIAFRRGLAKDELVRLISYFIIPKEELKKGAEEYLSLLGIENITVGKLGFASGSGKSIKQSLSFLAAYENCLGSLNQPFKELLEGKAVNYLELRFLMVNIMDNLARKYQEFAKLTAMKKYDVATFAHLLNVSILALYFSSKLSFSKDDCLDIGIAALFHDVGKIYISRAIIKKPDRLTDEEFSTIKSHTMLGAEILLKYTDTLGMLPPVVALEHHLRYDTKGYPKITFSQQPHIASLIISICDVYDALTQRRTYKRDYPPRAIYDLMLREKGGAFDPRLLESFFRIIGVWPTATIVLLSDNRVAVVRKINEDDIFSPVVEIISAQNKGELIDLKGLKDKLAIERSLNPLAEGKEYLPYI